MKKFVFILNLLLLSSTVSAQEMIPLFDETPTSVKKTNTVQSEPKEEKKTSDNISRPRLGRDAQPLTTLTIEPLPNTSFNIDISADKKKTEKTKKEDTQQVVENSIAESELIKRNNPLNMTESANTKKLSIQNQVQSGLNRHDVSKFKIVGIGFGDDTETVYDELTELGYMLSRVEKSIPLYRTTYYNDVCRNKKQLKIASDVKKCIYSYAEQDEMHYVFRETYTRPESRETVQVSYSSPDTNNVVFKVVYANKGDNSLNSSRINLAKKFKRRDDFWNLVFDAYGLPDENDKLLWGDENTYYMRAFMHGSAYDAYVMMEDMIIQDKDYENAQNDFKTLRKDTAFTLTGNEPDTEDNADSVAATD